MEDCTICVHKVFKDDFFSLTCCSNKFCNNCLHSLLTPLCPFCRKVIATITNDPKYKLALSYDSIHLTQNTIQNLTLPVNVTNSYSYPESRILRRQLRRERKLESREHDKRRNKELSRARKRTELLSQINEDIFFFEE